MKSHAPVVLWGGATDISRNNTKETLNLLFEFVNENKELNVVLINSPHRHDLLLESCVNQEVTKFSRQVKKQIKPVKGESFRVKFGQHLNSKETVNTKFLGLQIGN